jgi:spore germination cell wall hydrolase CwlJ-like protein
MYDITIDNVDLTPEEVIPETSETQAEDTQEIETEEITVDEAESSESSEEVPEEPYYVEEHLDPETDQRYVEESPLWLLAHIMMSEAGYCDSDERLKVGSVVLNRMNHPAFPDTMVEVLYCDNPIQYAPTICPNRFYQEPTEECWVDAQWLLDNGSILPGDVVYQATFPQGSAIYEYSKWGEYFCYY